MALIVRVYINDTCIIEKHAVRIKGNRGQLCLYRDDEGDIIAHHYDDGAAKLAIQLLEQCNAE